ncbi:MFS transporter [Pseudarthrobacter sulfonivorans]|uniref:MFS transporter n=1 Tax=Pseudarthrobacter sulfonivorans TaxID=121292 RepID=UPI00278A1282|nr:MFS transporter [Pseudarthrobacter sulfonivorans]MDP9998416.1 MFS family permease [Pseudarthrobacter sulfonivorans]
MATTAKVSPKRAAMAAFFGGTLEYYDFFIYGTAAALVLNQLFFSNLSPATGTIAAFATLAVGYLVRPIGAVVFGHIGDRFGRKTALIGTLLTMGLATVLIGVLPTTAVIGDGAAVLLIILRIAQGLGIGGELGNASILAVESAPPNRRGFYGSFASAGPFSGMVLSTGIFAALSFMPREDFMAWGWRVPFLLSAVLIVVTYAIRRHIAEPHVAVEVRREHRVSRFPIFQVARMHKKDVLIATVMSAGPGTVFYTVSVFGLSYAATKYGIPQSTMLILVTIASAVLVCAVPMWGALSDRIGRRKLIGAGMLCEAVFIFAYFLSLPTGNPVLILLGMVLVLGFGHALVNGVQPALFCEMFPVEVRSTAISLGQQLGGAINGLAPVIAASIIAANPEGWYWIATYAGGLCLLGAIATMFALARWRDIDSVSSDVAPINSGHSNDPDDVPQLQH